MERGGLVREGAVAVQDQWRGQSRTARGCPCNAAHEDSLCGLAGVRMDRLRRCAAEVAVERRQDVRQRARRMDR